MKRAFGVVFAILLAISAGCKKEANPVTPRIQTLQIVPLEIKNSWTRVQIQYDSLGSNINTSTYTDTVATDTVALGTKLYYCRFGSEKFAWRTNADSGLVWYRTFLPDFYYDPFLEYKYPASVDGYSWYDGHDRWVQVLSIDTVILVPAGTFHCIEFDKAYYLGIHGLTFVSPGVGEVKSVEYFPQYPRINPERVSSVTELTKYNLN